MGNCIKIFKNYQEKRKKDKKVKALLKKSQQRRSFYFKKYNLKIKNYTNLTERSYSQM